MTAAIDTSVFADLNINVNDQLYKTLRYFQTTLLTNGKLSRGRLCEQDNEIVNSLIKSKHLYDVSGEIYCTGEFWYIMSVINYKRFVDNTDKN